MKTLKFKHKHKGKCYKLTVDNDEYVENPRDDYDHADILHTWHDKYTIGGKDDENNQSKPDSPEEYKELTSHFAVFLPVFMMDHSNVSISTTPYSCPWDSGQVGVIGLTQKALKEESWDEPRAKAYLKSSVEELNQFMQGRVYRYNLEEFDTTIADYETIDSLSGIYAEDIDDAWDQVVKDHLDSKMAKTVKALIE